MDFPKELDALITKGKRAGVRPGEMGAYFYIAAETLAHEQSNEDADAAAKGEGR